MSLGYGDINENPDELELVGRLLAASSSAEVAERVRGYVEKIPYDDRMTALTDLVVQMAQIVQIIERAASDQGVQVMEHLVETNERLRFEQLTKDLDLDVD